MESISTEEVKTTEGSTCAHWLVNNKFDILMSGKNEFAIYWLFKADGTVESNQTMFNNAAYRPINANQF